MAETSVKTEKAVGTVDKDTNVYAIFIGFLIVASGVSFGIGTGSIGVAFGVALSLLVLVSVILVESEELVEAIRESKK